MTADRRNMITYTDAQLYTYILPVYLTAIQCVFNILISISVVISSQVNPYDHQILSRKSYRVFKMNTYTLSAHISKNHHRLVQSLTTYPVPIDFKKFNQLGYKIASQLGWNLYPKSLRTWKRKSCTNVDASNFPN